MPQQNTQETVTDRAASVSSAIAGPRKFPALSAQIFSAQIAVFFHGIQIISVLLYPAHLGRGVPSGV